ncbi:MAG: hypothetical protein HY784_15625 [Chloroflexi bacterium]|nr:hypothetical protein [Chloroflexota bacterium]
MLTSYHGQDRFAFQIYEGDRRVHLEFPNDSTAYCPELEQKLVDLLGKDSIQVEAASGRGDPAPKRPTGVL